MIFASAIPAAISHHADLKAASFSSGVLAVPTTATRTATPIAIPVCRIMVTAPDPVAKDDCGSEAAAAHISVGIVKPTPMPVRRHCHDVGQLRFIWQPVSEQDEKNQLQRLPLPTVDHSAGDLALPPFHPELARRRRLAGRTRHYRLLRIRSALGQPFRADHRSGLA